MPPSGYSSAQSDLIVRFLTSCSVALRSEGIQKKLDPCAVLRRECSDIVNALDGYKDGEIGVAVLKLTLGFYESILESSPLDYEEYDHVVQDKLSHIKETILSIHVEPKKSERPHNPSLQPIAQTTGSG